MKHLLFPDQYVESVHAIDYEELYRQGIRLLLFDNDNTLELYTTQLPGPEVRALFRRLHEIGFQMYLLSNGRESRVEHFGAVLNVPYFYRIGKPSPKGVRLAMEATGHTPQETVVIGDQIFTDLLAGKLAGAGAILTKPISLEVDELVTRPKRPFERLVIRRYLKWLKRKERNR
ncbi:MAG: YqeG family HAD IIIA-type phosphatase [Firmicutes bacterium]|nr:YqeG family HAD IIIA-type phosphatase [Bacillota bacterium]